MKWLLVISLMLLGVYGALKTNLRDDVLDLLPGQAVRADIETLQRLGLVNRVFISFEIEGQGEKNESDRLNDLTKSAEQVGLALKESKMFREVVYRLDDGYEIYTYSKLWEYLPSLTTSADLELIKEKITKSQIEKAITEDFARLNSPAGIALVEQVRRDPLGLIGILFNKLERLKGEFQMTVIDGYFLSKDRRSCLLWAESLSALTDSYNAQKVDDYLGKIIKENIRPGVKVRIIGTLPHTLANAKLVKKDLGTLLPLASISLLVFLLITLRARAILVMFIPLMAAPLAISSLNLIYERVSAIALGFGIVLLGIAVDFSIHLYLALSRQADPKAAYKRVARPITMAALSTIGVFIVLLFSEVPSHRQMATLAIIGLVTAIIFTFLLIPTIVGVKPNDRLFDAEPIIEKSQAPRWAAVKIILWLSVIIFGCWSWPQLVYDGDLRSLDVPNPQILKDEKIFRDTWRHNEAQIMIVARGDSVEKALLKNDQVYQELNRLEVDGVQSLSLLLAAPGSQQKNYLKWSKFWKDNYEKTKTNIEKIGLDMGFTTDAFSPFFDWLGRAEKVLEAKLILAGPLRPIIISMFRIVQDNRQTAGQDVLVTTFVADKNNVFETINMLAEDKDVTVISNNKWRNQVEKLMRRDIIKLSAIAGILIVILAGLFFRNVKQTLAALAPVFSALSAMAIFGVVTNTPLNMMHVLMGIMVIGLSVDYGIFMVCAKTKGRDKLTAKAVTICAVSTLIGFGVLAFAKHYALNTLGVTVLVGILTAWPTALLVTPAILAFNFGRKN